MKILIIEDDVKLVTIIKQHLVRYGFDIYLAKDFSRILETYKEVKPDLILLDINLPYLDGYFWCQKLREITKIPLIFISARDSNMDQVMALEYGADDYLVKPFSNDLMVAKIRSCIRRTYGDYSQKEEERVLKAGQLIFYPEKLMAEVEDEQAHLTFREGELLKLLLHAYPKVVKRELILNKLWDDERFVDDNTLSVNIGRLRKKLLDIGLMDPIQTIRGQGYVLQIKERSE